MNSNSNNTTRIQANNDKENQPTHTHTTMLSARIHEYQKPLILEETRRPVIVKGEQVLVRVGATGLCHSDLHLINGDWKDTIPLNLPLIPGHEVAGWVEEIGNSVPEGVLNKGDTVAVFAGWGCGICIQCKNGDEQLCNFARWPGIISNGGFSEYINVDSYRFLVKVCQNNNDNNYDSNKSRTKAKKLTAEEIAPLTDAGLTPYRAIKKIRNMLGPGKSIAIVGIGGLGYYGVQYAKILGQSANVIALDRKEEKLHLAESVGADSTVNTSKSMNIGNIREEVLKITSGKGIDVVIDCVGAENTIYDSIRLLNKRGILVVVGLFGTNIMIPLVPSVTNEYSLFGSLWGNYSELREVIELAKGGRLKHHIQKFTLNEINKAMSLLKDGKIIGRAVITPN